LLVSLERWTSLSQRAFAGPDYETAVFEPEAKRLLRRADPRALHYDVRMRS